MKKLLDFLHKYRWLSLAVAVVALATWVVVVGFGERLGVDAVVRAQVNAISEGVWTFFVTTLVAPLLRDKDSDGKIAAVDPDDTDPAK